MFPTSVVFFVSSSTLCVFSAALTLQINNISVSLPKPPNYSTLLSNKTIFYLTQNLSSSAPTRPPPPTIKCDGDTYKWDLVSSSCIDAASQIPNSRHLQTFGNRGEGVYDTPLPHRFISSDGLCYFDIVQRPGVSESTASLRELKNATPGLINDCLGRSGRQGGIAVGIGADRQLGLVMTSYKPNVQCTARVDPARLDECTDILSFMPASRTLETFEARGRRGYPHIELPDSFFSEDGSCRSTLRIDSFETDACAWYDIWEAVAAIDGMCRRYGKTGHATELGVRKSLSIDIDVNVEGTSTA